MNWSIRYQVSDSYSLLQSLGVSAVIKAGKLFSIEEMQCNAVVGPNRNLKISKSPLKSQVQPGHQRIHILLHTFMTCAHTLLLLIPYFNIEAA